MHPPDVRPRPGHCHRIYHNITRERINNSPWIKTTWDLKGFSCRRTRKAIWHSGILGEGFANNCNKTTEEGEKKRPDIHSLLIRKRKGTRAYVHRKKKKPKKIKNASAANRTRGPSSRFRRELSCSNRIMATMDFTTKPLMQLPSFWDLLM